jgi:2-keto-4-pentenoate hydratase/2-oxohepta-3-ene-1,7-dioic acid hydratase in catechol pathway
MAKFVRFTDSMISHRGPAEQSVYINPDHVRIVRPDYEYEGGSVIGLVGYDVSVREDLEKVIGILSSAPRP